jgi:hypothetical protein
MSQSEERKSEDADPLDAALQQIADRRAEGGAKHDAAMRLIAASLPSNSAPASWEAEMEKAVGVDEDGTKRYALRFYMRNKREEWGISMRQAAKQSGISEGRWRQLEAGHQLVNGEKVPVKTTQETVLKIASGMNMNPDVALYASDYELRQVRVGESGIWPLPRHSTVKRNPQTGQPDVIKGPHVTNNTLKKATARLRQLERLYEQVARLPLKDLESLSEFVEGLLHDAYTEQATIEAQRDADIERIYRGDDGWEKG